jgi:hypothetical protein
MPGLVCRKSDEFLGILRSETEVFEWNLFRPNRKQDAFGVQVEIIEGISEKAPGETILDRLRRAVH